MQVERLKALGLNWVRLALHWMLIEPEQGHYQLEATDRMMALVKQAGLHSVTYVVGTPRFASSAPPDAPYSDKYPPKDPIVYAQRMQALAKRYPNVDVWQVWNEPNIPAFWQPRIDPEGYGRLLQPAVAALRQVVPDKPIAMAGMAYYSQMAGREGLMLDAMCRLGAYKLDLIACYHPYTAEPEGA
jgi:beta-xylosidase